ncbi:hypothetical protein FQN54_009100 [Arachnomyces sp. PD_36]|nr:hypothetical protein FQN54_009100 [Arachnomyces sp. PD_36]
MNVVHSLTVGQVSGLIALGTSIGMNTLGPRTAEGRSVLARQLHASTWPSLLQTDSVTDRHVDWSVAAVAYLGLAFVFLAFVAGFVTPLGLGEGVVAVGQQTMDFAYAPDLSSFGRNTQPRPDMPLSRDCGNADYLCPGAIVPHHFVGEGYNRTMKPNTAATTGIPSNMTTLFSSATKDSTIASIFEIQYRSWQTKTYEIFGDNNPYVAGVYRGVDNLIPRENITIVEGAIVDMESGGIGFRNHTLPSRLTDGASWNEDLLWLEPDIACVNTNLSLEAVLGDPGDPTLSHLSKFELVDDGGFADLRLGNPYDSWEDIPYSDPDVRTRADRTAWLHNVLFAMTQNLTNSQDYKYGLNATKGRHYPLNAEGDLGEAIIPLGIASYFLDIGSLLDLPFVYQRNDGNLTVDGPPLYPIEDYPYEHASYLDDWLASGCRGNISPNNGNEEDNDYNVHCGYFLGFPSRVDGGSPLQEEEGSKWNFPLNVCAGTVQASIKTVSFAINGSTSLADLEITKIEDKSYADEASHPLWAFEDRRFPGYEGARVAPLWGMVDDSYEGTEGYNFSRRPSFYLPHTETMTSWDFYDLKLDSLAGLAAPLGILSNLFSSVFDIYSHSTAQYRGADNLVLRSKWSSLSDSTDGSELILRLVWTDMMASATVGTNTRGVSSPFGDGENRGSPGMVTIHQRRITYDMRYAIPAIFLLVIWLLVTIAAIVSGVIHRNTIPHMKQLINDTSVGRVGAATVDSNGGAHIRSTTKEWLGAVGHVRFRLGGKSYPAVCETYELTQSSGMQAGERSAGDENTDISGGEKHSPHESLLT